MLHKIFIMLIVTGTLIIQTGVSRAQSSKSTTPGTIVLGKISDKPLEKVTEYKPLVDYLAQNLSDFGIKAGKVKVARDPKTMARWVASGEVDIFFDNPYAALLVGKPSGGQPILFRVKEGAAEKYTIFYTLADSGLTSLSDLNGRMIALESSESASGYLLPIVHILEAGLNPVEKSRPDAVVAPKEVGYVFSYDNDNTVQWVFSKRVIAGISDDDEFLEISDENPGKLVVLAETERITRSQLGIASPDLDPALASKIVTLLIGLDDTEDGRTYLAPSETVRFEEISANWEPVLARINAMYELVHNR